MSKILQPNFDAWRGINAWHETAITPESRRVDMRFGQVVPTSDFYSIQQCAVNRARARTDPVDRAIVGGFTAPAVSTDFATFDTTTDYFEFPGVVEPAAFTMYAIFKTDSTTLGDTTANRFHVAGWYGGALDNGAVLMTYDETRLRGLLYQTDDTLLSNQDTLTGTDSTDWHLVGFRARSTGGANGVGSFQIVNLTTLNAPAETPITTARQPSVRNFRIGKAYASYVLETGQIAAVRLDEVYHTDEQMTAVAEEYRNRFRGSAVVF